VLLYARCVTDSQNTSPDVAEALAALQQALAQAKANQELTPEVLNALGGELDATRKVVRQMARKNATPRLGRQSARAQVIEALTDIGVPAGAPLIAAYHRAVFDSELHVKALASLRRDEERTVGRTVSAGGSGVFVVPALSTAHLTPVRGLFALSTWPTWLRLVGPYSERVNNLHAVRRMLQRLEDLGDDDEHRAGLESLVRMFGSSLDGVGVAAVDPVAVEAAVAQQLALIEQADRAERGEAASRLDREPDVTRRLLGAPLRVVGGGG
jgi:hypothetical protein